jgi:hypothetical protein
MHSGDVRYEMLIYENDQLLRTDSVSLQEASYEHQGFVITDLLPNTSYFFECKAIYQNPQTLREEEQIIYEEELTTLDDYTFTYDLTYFDEYIEITIHINDPNDYFQYAYYEAYDTTDEYDYYLSGQTYIFEILDDDKFITFTINIPTSSSYKIEIGISNQFNYNINQVIDMIEVD